MPEPPPSAGAEATQPAAMRALARQIFLDALREATVARAFDRNVECSRGVLRVCDDLYDLRAFTRVLALAIGKAAQPMAAALLEKCGSGVEGLIVSPEEAPAQAMLSGFRYYAGGHPLPTEGSLKAAEAALKSLAAQASRALVIFLLSGGGSALLEKPLHEELTLADLAAVHRALVFSGAPIAQVNAIRKHLSAVKGGRLAQAAHQGGATRQVSIMVSDVPATTRDALASGPTMPDSTSVDDCYSIAAHYQLLPELPQTVRQLFERRALEETPKRGDAAFQNARWWTVLSNASLEQAAAGAATRAGFAVEVDNTCDDQDYARAAQHLLERLRALRQRSERACLISGGEVTVTVPHGVTPGNGGRNQQFVAHCARQIAGENIAILSAGSDGIDGVSPAAGAVADGSTLKRAAKKDLDLGRALAEFNCWPLFHALGDEVTTGPTGNNIRDLRVLLAW